MKPGGHEAVPELQNPLRAAGDFVVQTGMDKLEHMDEAIVIKGRLVGPRNIELDEPVTQTTERVEVILHPIDPVAGANAGTVADFLRSLPPGGRGRDDIDRQLREERDNWDRNGGGGGA